MITGILACTVRVTGAAPGPVGFGTLPVEFTTQAIPIPVTRRSRPHQVTVSLGREESGVLMNGAEAAHAGRTGSVPGKPAGGVCGLSRQRGPGGPQVVSG